MKILFVINKFRQDSGGAVVDNRNLNILRSTYGADSVIVYEIEKNIKAKGKLYTKYLSLFGGISNSLLNDIKRIIKEEGVEVLFISNSIYGLISKNIRSYFKEIIIITFFHNVEYLYVRDSIVVDNIRLKNILPFFIKKMERLSVNNSDIIIALNKRDSDKLFSIYGRNSDFLLPTSIRDNLIKNEAESNFNYSLYDLELLFVGSDFFANIHGVNWFINNVIAQLKNVKLTVVGNGLSDKIICDLENVDVLGRVENLSEVYKKAHIVIMPIFLGSGMKTKTAEALMYGKPILATKEALEGYCIDDVDLIGGQCDTAIEFIGKINFLRNNKAELKGMGRNSRKLFLDKYSDDISMETFVKTVKVKLQNLLLEKQNI